MPTIHDCEKCTQECPQRQLARENAEKRMYATHEFVALQKEIEAGNLTYVVHSHWLWNKFSGEVRCKNCKAVVGTCFSEATFIQLKNEQHYCYNCGAKMVEVNDARSTDS